MDYGLDNRILTLRFLIFIMKENVIILRKFPLKYFGILRGMMFPIYPQMTQRKTTHIKVYEI